MDVVAHIENLSLGFQQPEGVLAALDRVDFHLRAGETLALLGESGCGKSLTSQAMMRLLPMSAAYGRYSRVWLGDTDLLPLPEKLMRQIRGKRLAMIFQEPMTALNPVLTIGQQLGEALTRMGRGSRRALENRMLALLEEVEMPQPALRLRQYPHQLSGGQKQRVVIAMALACEPDILVADEPTTALDVTVQAQILALLRRLQQQHQMSILLITHDLTVVRAAADRVCVMYAGQVVEQARVQDFFSAVEHPYSQLLLHALPSVDKRHQQLDAIDGAVPSLGAMPAACRFHPRCPYVFERCTVEEPQLQAHEERQVRCHLYPEHKALPVYTRDPIVWPQKAIAAEPLLEVKHLRIYFPGEKGVFGRVKSYITAVDDVSFSLRRGETLALVGESGCGKTTTSRAIMRLLATSGGHIYFAGKEVTTCRGKALANFRRQVQIIFQDPFSSMNPRMTVADIISEGMLAQGMSYSERQARLYRLLAQVNLPRNCLGRYPHQFSGGQRQRIGIARALACQPQLLICDEPTSALDVSVQAQILNLLKELQQEYHMAYLFITHDMSVVSYLADRVLVMRQGKMVEEGELLEILQHPQQDYTKTLLSSATLR
ncbi:MAG: ABC transporter ATP-binding protein [Legionellaceae bacterium]|nr:ABC transporter ATP-binding protein [Legionellaceae bacterium]